MLPVPIPALPTMSIALVGFVSLAASIAGEGSVGPRRLATATVQTPPSIPGHAAAAEVTGESLVQTEIVPLASAMEPGKPFPIGIRYKVAPKWHLYWRNPGESGAPLGIEWVVPEGFKVGQLEYPRPLIIEHPGEVTIGYEGEFVLRTTLTPPADRPLPEAISVEAKLDWLVCSNKCLMGRRTSKVTLAKGGMTPAQPVGEYPTTLEKLGLVATVIDNHLTIRAGVSPSLPGSVTRGSSIRFVPDLTPGVTYGATVPPAVVVGDATELTIPLTVKPQNALGEPLRAAGLVIVTLPDGKPAGCAEIAFPLGLPQTPSAATPAKEQR